MAANQGEVDISIGTLRCTLRASKEVSAHFGNFFNANARVSQVEHEAMVFVIAAGLGKTPAEVEESVYAAGLLNLSAPVKKWLDLLANGGREYVAPKPDEPDAPKNV